MQRIVRAARFGFVDNAHPSAAKFFDDSIMRDNLSDQGGLILPVKFHLAQGVSHT